MNAKMKKRMIAVSGVIVIVLILVLAFVGGNTAATTMSIAEAAENPQAGQKVQVSGNVVQDSFSTSNDVLTFKIYDPEGDPATQLEVRYDGAASSTFGNDVTAICTGKINDAGVLECSELVTKCPSKYENADSALTVEQLLGYGESVYGNVVKVAGSVGAGSLKAAGQGDRFILVDAETGDSMPVVFEGALVRRGVRRLCRGAHGIPRRRRQVRRHRCRTGGLAHVDDRTSRPAGGLCRLRHLGAVPGRGPHPLQEALLRTLGDLRLGRKSGRGSRGRGAHGVLRRARVVLLLGRQHHPVRAGQPFHLHGPRGVALQARRSLGGASGLASVLGVAHCRVQRGARVRHAQECAPAR